MTQAELYSQRILRIANYLKVEAPDCVEERIMLLTRVSELEPTDDWAAANIELAALAYSQSDKERVDYFVSRVLAASASISPRLRARAEVTRWELCEVDDTDLSSLVSAVSVLEGTDDQELIDGSAMLAFIVAESSPVRARRYLQMSLNAAAALYGELSIGYARAIYGAAEFELKMQNREGTESALALAEQIIGATRTESARLLLIQIGRFRRKHLQ
jgi:hypothetical protein